MRKFLPQAAGLLMICMVATGAGQGDIYRWKDVNGNWHYSDQPQAGAELVRGTRKPPTSAPSSAPTPANRAAPAASSNEPGAVDTNVAEQVRQEAAAAQAENCKKAEEGYSKAIQARRIYKIDAQGVKTFLTDAELDEARLNARIQRDTACKP